ncbi:MAG: hypothetical protein KC800_28985 [Candidatus Eremiobacteraeota bacterium]|nr:hypothetical protein [Candidatus Eremiobacteraeota bacterium]
MTHSLLFPILAVVMLCVASFGGNYQLDWSHTGVPPAPAAHLDPDAPPAPVGREHLPVITQPPPPRMAPRTPSVTPSDMHLAARQFFDHDKDRYVTVDRILTTVYHRGRYFSETHYNQAHYPQMDVVLEELEPGDRYQIEIFWDDGSRRWFDQTVRGSGPKRLYVDEPDPFTR